MILKELKDLVDALVEKGYGDVKVYFDTEAQTYHCHIVPIGNISLLPEEMMGEDYIIITEER